MIDAFRDVQAARADQERLQNEAQAYANRIIPEARGEAERILQSAQGYRDQVIAEAKGQATASPRSTSNIRKHPDVTRQRIFIETMEKVLGNADKVIVDDKAGPGVVPFSRFRSSRPNPPSRAAGDAAMNRGALTVFAVILGVAALVAYLTLFTVSQTQQALVLEFGKPKRVITDPGLQYKIPFIQNVEFFDKRILDIDTASQEVIASDKKRLVVDAFARYRIMDLLFFQTLRDERIAAPVSAPFSKPRSGACSADRASPRSCATSAIADEDDRGPGQPGGDAVRREDRRCADQARRSARGQHAGDLPPHADRAAARGGGVPRRRRGRRAAHPRYGRPRRTVIKAEATGNRSASARAMPRRNRIFAEAFGQDPDFFAFYRSMQAYEVCCGPAIRACCSARTRNSSNISIAHSATRFRTRRLRPPVPPARRTRPRAIPEGRSRGRGGEHGASRAQHGGRRQRSSAPQTP